MTQRFIHAPCSSSTASSGDVLAAARSPSTRRPLPSFKIGDAARAPFAVESLRTALELVAKSHRVFAGVGPNEAMIARFPRDETARRAVGPFALEVDDFLFLQVRELEVQRPV